MSIEKSILDTDIDDILAQAGFPSDKEMSVTPTNEKIVDSSIVTDDIDNTTVNTSSSISTPLPSLKNLPSLGSKDVFPSSKVNWGPNMKPAPVAGPLTSLSSANSSSTSLSNSKRMKSRNIQDNFTLDLQSQLSIGKPELSKIILSIKQKHDVSIESTLSKNARTFLISGTSNNVSEAKRELFKKITKPIDITFIIPSKVKPFIIGHGGKRISEISDKFDCRINIAKQNNEDSYDEDLDDYTVNVNIFGDFESTNQAKTYILNIVKEETKNATVRITIDDDIIRPFFNIDDVAGIPETVKTQYFATSGDIVLSGLREDTLLAKNKIQDYMNNLSSSLTEQKVKIPRKFQFLIDADELKKTFKVEVNFPTELNDEFVTFSGEESKVKGAIAHARESSKAFVVDALDISKAHSNNINHARYLTFYFAKYNALSHIEMEHPQVKITLPTSDELLANAKEVTYKISAKSDFSSEIKTVRKEIVALVNSITPNDVLIIDDLDYELFSKSIKQTLLATEEKYPFILVGDYFANDDAVVLFAPQVDEDDFKPSADEIKAQLITASAALDPLRAKLNNMSSNTFDIEADIQEKYFSPSSITFKLIVDQISNNGGHIQFKLNTPGKGKLTIRGDDKAATNTTKIVKDIIGNQDPKSTLTFDVPSNSVARLVGREGTNLNALRRQFDMSIEVGQSAAGNKDPVPVVLTGLHFNLTCAKTYILAEAKKWADVIIKEIVIPQKFHRNIIGPSGIYRTRLQDKYNVFINFSRETDLVSIRGPSRGAKEAYDELSALLDFERDNGHVVVVSVPAEHVPRVIGKSGDTINDIRAEFGVEMNFLQKATDEQVKESGKMDLEITGSRTAIKEASEKVKEIVAAAENYAKETINVDQKYHRIIVGTGGHSLREIISNAGGDSISNKNVNIPDVASNSNEIVIQGPQEFVDKVKAAISRIVEDAENSITKELNVPKERYGALIGTGGMVRRQIETEFKVTLNVPNKNEDSPVSISGLPENVEKAEQKIMTEILKEDFDVEIDVAASLQQWVSERGAFIQKLRNDDFINVRYGTTNRRAVRLNNATIQIPAERVRPIAEEQNTEKSRVVIEEVGEPRAEGEEGNIQWRLTYEPVDFSALLDEDESSSSSKPKIDAVKKQEVLDKAVKEIQQRINSASAATYAGYVWFADFKKFNRIVGPGGSNVKKIRDQTNCLINVPKRSDKVNDIIFIRGSKESVEKAAELVINSYNN